MIDDTNKVLKFEKMIDVVVSKYNDKEDLKQDLFLFLEEGLRNGLFDKAKNKDGYIFICLKNEALRKERNTYSSYKGVISLNKTDDTTGAELINLITTDEVYEEDFRANKSTISMEELKKKICQICSEHEYQLLYSVIILEINQKELAKNLHISQQAISKRIRKIIAKLRNNLKL